MGTDSKDSLKAGTDHTTDRQEAMENTQESREFKSELVLS